jgi:hypothetical protein
MFIITKSGKSKAYKTDCPSKAMEAYQSKHSLSLWHEQTVVRTKCTTGEHSSRISAQYLERC